MRTNISLAILALFVLVPFSGAFAQHTLTVESSAAVGAGGTVYRFYVNANDDTDKFSAVFGNNETHLVISAPDGIFNSPFNASWNASGINPAFLGAFPEMADDSYATIGLEGPASTSGLAGAADPSIVEDSSLNPTISGFFTAGGTMLDVNTLVGGSWYVLNTATNSLPIGGRWLVAQVTTTGSISGTMNYQVFPLGVGDDQKQFSTDFDGAGTFTGTCVIGCEGGPVDVLGCTDSAACNYDSSATLDDGSCASFDACGVCGGAGIPEGDCDCFGNQLDALGVCGGECSEDADADGICDDADECVGTLDACGVCNGPGAIYACGCSEVPSGDCDCDGNQLDACGVCGGDGSSCVGCMDSSASNYNADATTDNGSCVYATTFNVDMSCATNVGAMLNGSTGFSEVFVTGPIFGWAANDGYNQLTDADGDGIYSVTLDFPAGDVEYKYAIDGFNDQEQLIDDMQNGADCAPVTDFAGYANRQVVAGSATNDTYGSCSTCADQVDPVNVTFQVDMSQYAEPYAFGGVFVNGSFNGWCGVCNPLTDTGGGLWSVTLPLNPGTIEYKFTLDGWNYQEEFAGGESCTSTIDGYTNRSLTFDADVTLAAVCWESCDVCPDTSDVLGCMDSSANNYNAEATVEPENSCLYDVTLSVDASQTSFTSMTLAGTFNGWNNLSNPMDDSDGDGVYFVTVSMTAGNQEYKFLGNGDWGVAEVFDGSESCTTPPAEFVNRVILVEGPTVADTVCYNTCEACVDGAVLGCTDESANNYNAGADTDDGSCLYNTTFNVDMSCAGVDFTEVFVTGPLWGWPANSGFNAMTDADGDGIYSVTIETPAGNIEYKYAINGFADQENLIDDMQNGASCAPVTDYNGYANRLAASGSTTNDTYGSCEACPQGVEGCIDETACNYNPEANTDDGSCEFAPDYYECDGETCINDTDGDGVCDELEVEGCVVPTACNYVASGVTQLVPCVYPDPGYNCDGTCISDTDGDGTCDANEIVGCQDSAACNYDASATDEGTCDYDSCLGCTDEAACNYDDSATQDDGTCDFCSCANEASGGVNGFNLSVETHAEDGIPGLTTYRVYVTTPNATDFVSAIAGDSEVASYLRTSTSFYQNPLGGLTAGAINPLFFGSFPDIQYDSWLTIGIDQAPVPGDGTADVTIAQAAGDTWPQDFEAGGNLEMDSFFGGSWFTTNLTSNGVAGDDLKVLVAQLTTDGSLTGQLFVQVFPLGVGADAEYLTLSFGNSTCGCTDASACNYSEGAIYDDGSCFFVGIYDCDASCVNDADQDGVCDELEIVGCSDSEACNYNPDATDEGACEYVEPTLLPSEGGCGLFFSGYAEGSGNHKFMEIYNPTDADIDLSGYAFPNVSNAPDNGAGNYDFWNAFPEGAMIAAGDVYVIAHGSADASILAEADMTFNFLSNGDDGFMLVQGDEANYIMIDAIGDFNGDPGSGWDVAGVTNGTQNHSLIRKSNITSGNGGDWIGSAGTDAENSEWIVLDQDDWTGVGSHEFTGDCAAGNYAVIYDCDGVCLNDSDQDGVCDEIEIDGCTDSGACNYDLLATDEDGSCEYLTCAGCTDPVGCNYDSSATIEDGSCTYPEAFYDCDGNCVNDLNINGICDELEVLGCTYSAACNYDMDANVDDGQCDFSCLLTGCTDTAADNYDAAATVDDGNCFYVGCLDSNALNYDSGANFPGNCEYCEGDFNYDGEVDVNDLLDFFQLWGNTCD